jgi:transketolase
MLPITFSTDGEHTMTPLDATSIRLRRLLLETIPRDEPVHLGSALSLVEILRVLFSSYLRLDPQRPGWPDRDRLVLSKGHGGLALYTLLAHRGLLDRGQLMTFGRRGSAVTAHPERGAVPGVEASTGSLGHGLPLAVGIALAARLRGRPSRTVVVTGDGELNEGSNWEAALHAAKHRLDRLSVFVDHNGQQCFGADQDVVRMHALPAKFESFGFSCAEVDGHSVSELTEVTARLPLAPGQPSAVICRTVKGRGVPAAEGSPSWHHLRIDRRQREDLIRALDTQLLSAGPTPPAGGGGRCE